MTLRAIRGVERTVVVVHSITFDVPDHLIPTAPAYEQRFLCLVLSLLRAPGPGSPTSRHSRFIRACWTTYFVGLVPD